MQITKRAVMLGGAAVLALPLFGLAVATPDRAASWSAQLVGSTTSNGNGSGNNGNGTGTNGNGVGNADAFTVSATADGLYPGRQNRPLSVTLHSTSNQPITITSLSGIVSSVSNPDCPTSTATVGSWNGAISLPVNGNVTRTDLLSVSMKDSAVNACASATFNLTFTGTATR